jgi:hypothetical protein
VAALAEPALDASANPAVRAVFERKRREARGCYEKALQVDPTASGQAALKVEIAANGIVVGASLERSDILSQEFQRCLIDASKSWWFEDALAGRRAIARFTYAFGKDPSPFVGPPRPPAAASR